MNAEIRSPHNMFLCQHQKSVCMNRDSWLQAMLTEAEKGCITGVRSLKKSLEGQTTRFGDFMTRAKAQSYCRAALEETPQHQGWTQ